MLLGAIDIRFVTEVRDSLAEDIMAQNEHVIWNPIGLNVEAALIWQLRNKY